MTIECYSVFFNCVQESINFQIQFLYLLPVFLGPTIFRSIHLSIFSSFVYEIDQKSNILSLLILLIKPLCLQGCNFLILDICFMLYMLYLSSVRKYAFLSLLHLILFAILCRSLSWIISRKYLQI